MPCQGQPQPRKRDDQRQHDGSGAGSTRQSAMPARRNARFEPGEYPACTWIHEPVCREGCWKMRRQGFPQWTGIMHLFAGHTQSSSTKVMMLNNRIFNPTHEARNRLPDLTPAVLCSSRASTLSQGIAVQCTVIDEVEEAEAAQPVSRKGRKHAHHQHREDVAKFELAAIFKPRSC